MFVRIGIMTLSASDNCGSLLQSYALKTILENLGNNVEIINFTTEQSHNMYDIIPKYVWKHPRTLLYHLKSYGKLKSSAADYTNFRKKNLGLNGLELYPKDLKDIKDNYDIIVAGSDQIWNVNMADYDDAFFCGWTDCKKVAYAPSLGGHDIQESADYNKIQKWVNSFSNISVRENKGKLSLERATDKNVELVLDPTLVLEPSEWKKIVGERLIKEKYIFYYSWAYCEDSLKDIVKKEAERRGCKVYVVDPKKWIRKSEKNWGFNLCKENGPLAFLNLMYYSELNFVESFHGMIFSYIFKKDFWLLDTNEKYENMNTRLIEISDVLQVQDRVISPYNFTKVNMDKKIDFDNNTKLQKMREKSMYYIKQSIM